MEKKTPKPMTPFDDLVTTQELQMMKLFLPYTPSANQQFMGIFIKFLELKETINFFSRLKNGLHTQAFKRDFPTDPAEMLQELRPYMPPQQAEMMDTFSNMMNIMEMVQMFDGGPGPGSEGGTDSSSGFGSGGGFAGMGGLGNLFSGNMNPMDMMMGMMTPDQQNMFQMYNDMFANEMDTMDNQPGDTRDNLKQKGDDTDERMDEQPGNEKYRPS